MPQEFQDVLVKFGPWLLLIMVVLSIFGILGMAGFGSIVSPMSYLAVKTAGGLFMISWLLSIVVLGIDALALPGLFKKDMKAWRLLYYATLVGIVQNLIAMNILGAILGAGIGFYILFQIKHNYK